MMKCYKKCINKRTYKYYHMHKQIIIKKQSYSKVIN